VESHRLFYCQHQLSKEKDVYELTMRGDRLEMTPVLGLSISNRKLKCGASCSVHSSKSCCNSSILRNDTACEVAAGYTFRRIVESIRANLNSASPEESLVDSPGMIVRNPVSVTYSSSASAGYSQCTSPSAKRVGKPRCAEEKLWLRSDCDAHTKDKDNLPV
jgi:hypothetical protein